MSLVDEISPRTMGENRIALALDADLAQEPALLVFQPIIVTVDYSACDPEGVVLPLEFTVTGPSGKATFLRKYFRRTVPAELTFTPTEGGTHLVRLAECFHNRWWGSLLIDVAGDALDRRS